MSGEGAAQEFARLRDEFAAGRGIPEALAYSPEASRQWVSDELSRAARDAAARDRAGDAARLARLGGRAAWGIGALLALLAVAQPVAALLLGDGWPAGRTAALVALVPPGAAVAYAALRRGTRGGVLAPLIGDDNRLSTSRAVAAAWLLVTCHGALAVALTGGGAGFGDGAGLLASVAVALAVTVWTRHTVATRVRGFRMQKVRADRPRAADLLTDDGGRGSFTAGQYVAVGATGLLWTAAAFAREPGRLPAVPWPLVLLGVASALAYVAARYTEGGRPVIQSIVRVREAGDLHAPIRHGDELEIRGSGFVPAGAAAPDRLAETVVRIGGVEVPVPLVPVTGGFSNPGDTRLRVPVPVELDPGAVEVQVITAAGTESGRYVITVAD
ncbi:hypothetical protein [Streptomyces avicenniae]|uniref:hypothetical protein n=1 Tax=Streptomyces avicenniae TaxID=500153 RepID=UPI00069A0DF1|nr:hypothetical protein [Streptomyces avicenniae]